MKHKTKTPLTLRWSRWWSYYDERWCNWAWRDDFKPRWPLPRRVADGLPEWWFELPCRVTRRHVPMMDQCGMPEHDYCTVCSASTPGQAPERKNE